MAKSGTLTWICCVTLVLRHVNNVDTFDVTILHTNDVHSRVDQFNKYGNDCSASDAEDGECFGGVARLQTLVDDIRGSIDNVLLLDAGDQYLGTLWFNVYKGLASSFFMDRLRYDAMFCLILSSDLSLEASCKDVSIDVSHDRIRQELNEIFRRIQCIGNHEFDLGAKGFVPFLDNITFPVVSANTIATDGSPIRGRYEKSVILSVGGERVGVIGYITPNTAQISTPGNTVRFVDVVPAVQEEVTRLTNLGINKIIALGHAGYNTDLQVAQIDGVDVVIGGHTNTFLYNGEPPSIEDPTGAYPTVVTRSSGQKAIVVQAYTYGKYTGYLNVTFNNDGELEAWSGNPIIMNSSISEDPTTKSLVDEWAVAVTELNSKVVGTSKVFLNGDRAFCRTQECNMGNLITDAVIDYHLNFSHPNNTWAPAAIALWNGGGIRASIKKGQVTIGNILTVLPFNNEVDLLKLKGSVLREQLEHAVQGQGTDEPSGKYLQFSGLHVVYDIRPVKKRVISVEVRCLECDIPSYSPLDDDAEYKILTNGYIADGGDGFNFQPIERFRFSTLESTVLSTHFERHSPVIASNEGRIIYKNPDMDDGDDGTSGSKKPSVSVIITFTTLICLIMLR